jgi:hypothetical protein
MIIAEFFRPSDLILQSEDHGDRVGNCECAHVSEATSMGVLGSFTGSPRWRRAPAVGAGRLQVTLGEMHVQLGVAQVGVVLAEAGADLYTVMRNCANESRMLSVSHPRAETSNIHVAHHPVRFLLTEHKALAYNPFRQQTGLVV